MLHMATGITQLAFPLQGAVKGPGEDLRGGSAEVGTVCSLATLIFTAGLTRPGASSVFTGFVAEII